MRIPHDEIKRHQRELQETLQSRVPYTNAAFEEDRMSQMNKVQHIKSTSLLSKQRSYGTIEDTAPKLRSNSKEVVTIMEEVNLHNDRYKRNRGPYQNQRAASQLQHSPEAPSRFSNFKPKRHSSYNSHVQTN